jgi:hypothetical protein
MPAILALVLAAPMWATAATGEVNEESISKIMGARAITTADGVVRAAWPRDDVALAVHGLRFPPAMELTSWLPSKKRPAEHESWATRSSSRTFALSHRHGFDLAELDAIGTELGPER